MIFQPLLLNLLNVYSKSVNRFELGQFETVWQICTSWHIVHGTAQKWNGGPGSDILGSTPPVQAQEGLVWELHTKLSAKVLASPYIEESCIPHCFQILLVIDAPKFLFFSSLSVDPLIIC